MNQRRILLFTGPDARGDGTQWDRSIHHGSIDPNVHLIDNGERNESHTWGWHQW